jgi:hypothetical protein
MSGADPGAYVGAVLVGAFLLLMARILYWLVVIVPRKTKEIYLWLQTRGYTPLGADDDAVARTLERLAAIHPKDPMADAELRSWDVKRAALRDRWGCTRLLVNAMRLQRDRPGGSTSCSTTILVETRPVPVSADVHLVPALNRGSVHWKERYGLEPIASGLDEALLTRFQVYAAPGATAALPGRLVQALVELCPRLVETSRFCFQHGVSLRFQREGWGITTSNEVYRREDMELLLELADRVAEALQA